MGRAGFAGRGRRKARCTGAGGLEDGDTAETGATIREPVIRDVSVDTLAASVGLYIPKFEWGRRTKRETARTVTVSQFADWAAPPYCGTATADRTRSFVGTALSRFLNRSLDRSAGIAKTPASASKEP